MKEPKISVIVPVYNVEKYLRRCIDSILAQTFTDFELLLIDDGSKDSSGAICEEYAVIFNKIKVFHKKNGGLSSARNYGIEHSESEYIIFLDSDDFWLRNDVLERFVTIAEKYELDVVRGELQNVDSNGIIKEVNEIKENYLVFSEKVLDSFEMFTEVMCRHYFSWLFFLRRSSLKGLRFDENRKFQEDIDFAIRLFTRNLKCGYLPLCFYGYRQRDNSIMTTPRIVNITDSFGLCDVFWRYSSKVEDKRLSDIYQYNAVMTYRWTLETLASDMFHNRYNEIDDKILLNVLWNKTLYRASKIHNNIFSFYIYVPPVVSVRLFRLRWWAGRILRNMHIK